MKKFDLDDLFKNALEDQEYKFDSKAFKEFQTLSNNAKEKKKRLPFLWILLGIFIVVISGIYIISLNRSQEKITSTVNKSSTVHQEPAIDKIKSNLKASTDQEIIKAGNEKLNLLTINNAKSSKSTNLESDQKVQRVKDIFSKPKLSSSLPDTPPIINNTDFTNSDNIIINTSKTPNSRNKTTYNKSNTGSTNVIKSNNSKISQIAFIPTIDKKLKEYYRSQKINLNVSSELVDTAIPPKRLTAIFLGTSIGKGQLHSNHYSITAGVEKPLTANLSIGSGLMYNYIAARNLKPHRGFAQKFNVRGSNFYHNSIEADQFHLISIPLLLNYKYKKISLSTGMQYSYILGIHGTITDNKDGIEASRSTWIVENGIHRNILRWQSGVSFDLCSRWTLDLSYHHFTKSLFTEQRNAQKLSALTLGVRYYLKK